MLSDGMITSKKTASRWMYFPHHTPPHTYTYVDDNNQREHAKCTIWVRTNWIPDLCFVLLTWLSFQCRSNAIILYIKICYVFLILHCVLGDDGEMSTYCNNKANAPRSIRQFLKVLFKNRDKGTFFVSSQLLQIKARLCRFAMVLVNYWLGSHVLSIASHRITSQNMFAQNVCCKQTNK